MCGCTCFSPLEGQVSVLNSAENNNIERLNGRFRSLCLVCIFHAPSKRSLHQLEARKKDESRAAKIYLANPRKEPKEKRQLV
jgi:hypothetical protein